MNKNIERSSTEIVINDRLLAGKFIQQKEQESSLVTADKNFSRIAIDHCHEKQK